MTLHGAFLSLVAEQEYEKAADLWTAYLKSQYPRTSWVLADNEFTDLRERLGDRAAALDVADALADAA